MAVARFGLLSLCVLIPISIGCRPESYERRIEVHVPATDGERHPADDLRTFFGPRPAVHLQIEKDSRPKSAKVVPPANAGVFLPRDQPLPRGIKTMPVP